MYLEAKIWRGNSEDYLFPEHRSFNLNERLRSKIAPCAGLRNAALSEQFVAICGHL